MTTTLVKSHGFASGVGSASYNGITFPAQISASGNSRPVYDSANRQTKYVEHNLTIQFIIVDGTYQKSSDSTTSVDDVYQDIRRRLTQAGGTLIFNGKGFGNIFNINTTQQDVAMGPKPQVLSWEPIAGAGSIRCVWEVSVQVAECENGEGQGGNQFAGRMSEFNFDMSWSISAEGLTQRTISGHCELPLFRTSPAVLTINDTVDRMREKFKIPVPLAFERSGQTWSVSEDKRTLNFTITDSEIPSDSPYFPGVIRISAPQRLSNTNKSFQMWNVSISASIELAMGVPKWFAWAAFLMILQSRRSAITNARINTRCGSKPGKIVITNSISIEDDPYTRTFNFDINWLLACDLKTLFQGAGVFKSVDGPTWEGWRASMTNLTRNWSARGHAGMKHMASDDAIINLCTGPQTASINSYMHRGRTTEQYQLLDSQCPSPESSWLVFQNDIEVTRKSNSITHYPLVPPEQATYRPLDPSTVSTNTPSAGTRSAIVQRRTQSYYIVRMRGYAMRVCHKVPNIQISQYGGRRIRPIGDDNQSQRLLGKFDLPVYISRWDKQYQILGTPNGIDEPEQISQDCF